MTNTPSTYVSPDRATAIAVQRQTLGETAKRLGMTEGTYAKELARVLIRQIDDLLAKLRTLPNPQRALIERKEQERRRLLTDASYVAEFRQNELEYYYAEMVGKLASWMQQSPQAQAMVDRRNLEHLARRSSGTVPELAAAAALRCQITAPLTIGFQALAMPYGPTPVVSLYTGISDCFHVASKMIVGAAVRFRDDGAMIVRDLRGYPQELRSGVERSRELIRFASGEIAAMADTPLGANAAVLASQLDVGAHAFVLFHELGHILLPQRKSRHDEEYKCDEFAARVIVGAREEQILCGMVIGLMFFSCISRRSGLHEASASHPAVMARFSRVWSIVESSGGSLGEAMDALLSIPTRLMQEEEG